MNVITPLENIDHCVSGDSMQRSKGSHCHVGIRKLFAPGAYLAIGEMCRRVIFAVLAVAWRWGATVFGVAIQDVIGIASQPEMRRIYTKWIVPARAIVAHQHAVWNRPVVQFVRNARCFRRMWFGARTCLQRTVTMTVLPPSPQPTIIGAAHIYLFPEAFGNGAYRSDLVVMTADKSSLDRFAASTFTAFGGNFMCVHRCNSTPFWGAKVWQMFDSLLPFSVVTGD